LLNGIFRHILLLREYGIVTRFLLFVVAHGLLCAQFSAKLKPQTNAIFQAHVDQVEAALGNKLWVDQQTALLARAQNGEVITQAMSGSGGLSVKGGGLIHDWVGATYVKLKPQQVIDILTDYPNHPKRFPEVVSAKVIAKEGSTIKAFQRLRKKQILEVTLHGYYDVNVKPGPTVWQLHSRSTKIQEIDNAGKSDEKELAAGDDHGFLWRINSYWTIRAEGDGSMVECRSVSLSRDVPTGLGMIIRPIIKDLPRESFVSILKALR
jgi:hypothetical protein